VAPLTCWSVSPLSNSARRADRLSEAWLRVCCKVARVVDRARDGGGGLDLFLLLDALRAGFGFLPRPRWEPLRIDEGWTWNCLVKFHGLSVGLL
jgi:hypothetical protein